jgi:hypothetical protein
MAYETSKNQIILGRIGRTLMDISANAPMKGLKDEDISRYNRMATFGDTLTRFGTTFGPRNLEEVLKTSGISQKEAAEFIKLGYTQ